MTDLTATQQRDKDFEKYRGRIRRKILHRLTRSGTFDGITDPVHNRRVHRQIRDAITEVLAEEIK